MKKWYLIVSFVFLSVVLLGCKQSDNGGSKNATNSITLNMPKDMPDDFGFSIQFGVEKKNEINTFEWTVTKDLIVDGTASTELVLTRDELQEIYKKMQEMNIFETKDFTPKPINGTVCMQEPHEDDEWKIIINGQTLTYGISGEYCEPTNDAKQLIDLRNYVFTLIKSKPEYQSLPASNGGYD